MTEVGLIPVRGETDWIINLRWNQRSTCPADVPE